MRCAILTPCVLLSINLSLGAEPAPATQPAASETPTVLVLPFAPPNDPTYQWMSASLQQDIASALAANLRGRAVAPTTAPAVADSTAAIEAARPSKASAVVFGQIQIMGKEFRVTGQVLDASTGKSFGSIKKTGPVDQLFRLEDELGPQILSALPTEFLNLRGIQQAREVERPKIITLPGDTQTPLLNNGPLDQEGPSTAYGNPTPLAPAYGPPYSPDAGSYPYRFPYPYSHLFSYDYDPDPFLPLYGGWRGFGDDGRRHYVSHPHGTAVRH